MKENFRSGIHDRKIILEWAAEVSQGFTTKESISIITYRVVQNMIGKIAGRGWEISYLNYHEEQRLNKYLSLLQNEDSWDRLSPLEKIDLRERSSQLLVRKSLFPKGLI